VAQHGFEGWEVAVNVTENDDAHQFLAGCRFDKF
jgi:hypothetical protein